jgi:Trypsin-co-occurring domain 1
MTKYLQFNTGDQKGGVILVEVDEEENFSSSEGLVKVGIKDGLNNTVAIAKNTFANAIEQAIYHNVQGLIDAIHRLPERPTEVEINFGLKITGEVGNVAVGKAGGEVNYTVKLSWKQLPSSNS